MRKKEEYFFFNNRIFKGNLKDLSIVRITYLLILGFTILFILFNGVHLYINDEVKFLFVYFILFLGTMYNLFNTQFKDPGIILKNNEEKIHEIELAYKNEGNIPIT